MDKRIKELITQAGGHWNHGDFNMPSSVEFQEQDIEKFAQLIVRECANFVYYKAEKSMSQEIVYVGDDLLKHFGVEE